MFTNKKNNNQLGSHLVYPRIQYSTTLEKLKQYNKSEFIRIAQS